MILAVPRYGNWRCRLAGILFASTAGYNRGMTPKNIRRIGFYATGIVASLAFIIYVQHWVVAAIIIPGWCLALWNLRNLEMEITELNKDRHDRDRP
jgi:hypothetical protein